MVIVHGITFAITWLQRLHGLNHLSDLTALENLYEVCLSSAMDDKLNPGISTVKQKGINIQTSCHYSILLCGGRCLWFWILIPLWVFFFFLLRVFYTIMWFLILHTLLFKPHFFVFVIILPPWDSLLLFAIGVKYVLSTPLAVPSQSSSVSSSLVRLLNSVCLRS